MTTAEIQQLTYVNSKKLHNVDPLCRRGGSNNNGLKECIKKASCYALLLTSPATHQPFNGNGKASMAFSLLFLDKKT